MSENQLFAKTSSLGEIIDVRSGNGSVFNEYVPKSQIGEQIFKELHRRLHKEGFVLQDGSNDVGILSQCQCLQSLVSLAQDFGLDFNKNDYFQGQKGTIREIMDMVIEDVINRVSLTDENGNLLGYVFDSTPYTKDHYSLEYSNLDSITWVVTSFFLILKYHAKVGEVCKWEATLIDIIKYGLKYINDAFIQSDKSDSDSGFDTGWNFTKHCSEPSLYFSFAVCECYLDFYSTFEPFLKYLHAEKNCADYGVSLDDEEREAKDEYEKKAEEYEAMRNRKVGKLKARYDEYNELARIFRLINDINDYNPLTINGNVYGTLEENCKKVAKKIWSCVHTGLADNFYYNNLKTTVGESELRMSTTSDVLFNTVYIVNILVGAGLDEVLSLERKAAILRGDSETAKKKEREYDNMLESCLLAVQKAFRTYESLKSNGKDYIVDQFLVGFNEDFDGHDIPVNELRKLRMRCFSLLPMLIHSNNVISEYLVKYPQYNMRKYLEYILDNRLVAKDGSLRWIWESDGFFSGSNYYYVLALNEFYLYYENYEKTYIDIGRSNKAREDEIKAKHLVQLQKPNELIGKKDAEISQKDVMLAEKNERIAALEQELLNVKRPVEDAVREIVEEEMKIKLAAMMSEVFGNTAKALAIESVDPTTDDGTYSKLVKNMADMMTVVALSNFSKTMGDNSAESYNSLKKKLRKDMKDIILEYIGSVQNSEDGESRIKKLFK